VSAIAERTSATSKFFADDAEALKKVAKLSKAFLAGTRGPKGTIWLDERARGAARKVS